MKTVIIGAGPGGYHAASLLARKGMDTTLIEKEQPGGTCLNWGCIPSKVFRHTADMLAAMQHAHTFGILTKEAALDMALLQKRREAVQEVQRKGILSLLKADGVQYREGTASLTANRVLVDGQELEYDRLILATGTVPLNIAAFAFDGSQVLSSDDMFRLEKLPDHLAIIGGGVIGCEFAGIMADFGVQVTLIEALDRLLPLPGIDADISRQIQKSFKKKKIAVRTSSLVQKLEKSPQGIRLTVNDTKKNKESFIEAECALVVIGRAPATQGLSLEKAGIALNDKQFIAVNSTLQTSNPAVFALGDSAGPLKPMLAHTASYDAHCVARTLCGQATSPVYDTVPSAIFTSPEVGCVGLTEQEATDKGYAVKTASRLMRTTGKAHVLGEIEGFVKLVADKDSGRIIGFHMAGAKATELLGEASVLIRNKLTADAIAHTIHAHPTLSEVIMETCQQLQST